MFLLLLFVLLLLCGSLAARQTAFVSDSYRKFWYKADDDRVEWMEGYKPDHRMV